MSIGNQEFGIPRKYQYQIGIWYLCPKFLGIFLVFYRCLEYGLVKIWFNIGIFGRIKIGLVVGFCGCHFIGIGLVSDYHFPESGISTPNPHSDPHPCVIQSHPANELIQSIIAAQSSRYK